MEFATKPTTPFRGNDNNGPHRSRRRKEHRFRSKAKPELAKSRDTLEREGYCFGDFRDSLSVDDLRILVEAARSAPADLYDTTASRFRRYHQAIYFPWTCEIAPVPPFRDGPDVPAYCTYFQASSFNTEYGNLRRRFAPFGQKLLECRALSELIENCFQIIPRSRLAGFGRRPVLVGMHIIRLESDGRRAAVATPNLLHQDGEPFTFVIMLERKNAQGGISYIANSNCAGSHPDDVNDADILATATLTEPLDMVGIDDARVAHHVSSVLSANGDHGSRSVLLLDFSELTPARTPLRASNE